MNDQNKKLAIAEELRRSDEAYLAADLLFRNGFVADAISKLYYHLLYHTRALLILEDLEPRSHGGVLRLFGLHFVKTGIFSPNSSHVLSKMMKFREEADYNPAYTFTEEDYKEFLKDVADVAGNIRRYLSDAGTI